MNQTTVCLQPSEVSSPVLPYAVPQAFKPLRGELRIPPVTDGQKPALDDDLFRRLCLLRPALIIEDRHGDVRHGVTNGNHLCSVGLCVEVDEELADEAAFSGTEAIHQSAAILNIQLEVLDVAPKHAIAFEPDESKGGKPTDR